MKKPILTVLAGQNGAGKSSIYGKIDPAGEFINADLIESEIPKHLTKLERLGS
jgi:predicted ABC-type ATPase